MVDQSLFHRQTIGDLTPPKGEETETIQPAFIRTCSYTFPPGLAVFGTRDTTQPFAFE